MTPIELPVCQHQGVEFSKTYVLKGRVSLEAAAPAVRALLSKRAQLEQRNEQTLTAKSGSRLAYRLFGAMVSGPDLPQTLRLEVDPSADEPLVKITMASDQGWYLFSTSLAENAYRNRFDRLLEELKAEFSLTE